MKFFRQIVLLSLSLFGCYALGRAQHPTSPVRPEWREFVSADAGFKALFPGTPRQVKYARGVTPENTFQVALQSGYAYRVGYTDDLGLIDPKKISPEIASKAALIKIGDGVMILPNDIKVLSEQELSIDGHPGREIRAAIDKGQTVWRARFYLVNNRLFEVAMTGIAAQVDSLGAKLFFESFALVARPEQ